MNEKLFTPGPNSSTSAVTRRRALMLGAAGIGAAAGLVRDDTEGEVRFVFFVLFVVDKAAASGAGPPDDLGAMC